MYRTCGLSYIDLTYPMVQLTDILPRTNARAETHYDNVCQETRQSPFGIWPFATMVEAIIYPY